MATADRRQQLIDTARRVFATRGFEGATTREIAAAAGVTEAVIFQHFAGKQALYDAILAQKANEPAADRWFASLWAARESGDDAETLRRLLAGIIQQHADDPDYLRLVMFSSLEGHPVARRLHARGRRLYDFVESFVVERQASGLFRQAPPPLLVRVILALPIYYVMQQQLFKTPWPAVDRDDVVREGARAVLAGLMADAPEVSA
jgi:TetR/AcrR family transcriptional regulator